LIIFKTCNAHARIGDAVLLMPFNKINTSRSSNKKKIKIHYNIDVAAILNIITTHNNIEKLDFI
jgi:hypothetical protein